MVFNKYFSILVTLGCFKVVASITNSNSSDDHAEILWQLSDLALRSQGRQHSLYSPYPSGFKFPSYQQYRRPEGYPHKQNNLKYQGYYQNYNYPQQQQPEYLQGEYPSNDIPDKPLNSNYYPQKNPFANKNLYKYPYPSYYPQKYPYKQPERPTRESVMDVLFSIAQNDDLQCVPKLVCQLTAGTITGRQLGLPVNISPQTLLGLLTTFNSAQSSPILHFGKAAFLGLTSKGNSQPCALAYPTCPSDSTRLITYLNNHKGGFFRFFQGLMSQPQNYAQYYDKYNPYYYRGKQPYAEKRIVTHVPTGGLNNGLFFDDENLVYFPKEQHDYQPYSHNAFREENFESSFRDGKKLAFPYEETGFSLRTPKKLRNLVNFEETNDNILDIQRPLPNHVPNPMIFPDRTGTGELKLDYNAIFDTNSYNKEQFSFPNK